MWATNNDHLFGYKNVISTSAAGRGIELVEYIAKIHLFQLDVIFVVYCLLFTFLA